MTGETAAHGGCITPPPHDGARQAGSGVNHATVPCANAKLSTIQRNRSTFPNSFPGHAASLNRNPHAATTARQPSARTADNTVRIIRTSGNDPASSAGRRTARRRPRGRLPPLTWPHMTIPGPLSRQTATPWILIRRQRNLVFQTSRHDATRRSNNPSR
jgi:hypothetical protein